MERPRSWVPIVIVLLAFIAYALRALSLDAQSLWRDEVDALRFAAVPRTEVLSHFTCPGWNGPLYYLLLRWWIAATGNSEYAMRFFALFFGVLCVPLMYVLGSRLFGWRTGLVAALLVAFSPYLTWYGQEVRMYTLVPALAVLAIYSLRRAIEGEAKRWWVVQILSTSMAYYSHILAALLVPVQALLLLVWCSSARRRWVGASVSLACLMVPYLPLARWQIPLALEARATGFPSHSLAEMTRILLDAWGTGFLGTFGWGWPWGAGLMAALAVGGLLSGLILSRHPSGFRREGAERDEPGTATVHCIAVVCWAVTPLLGVWLVSLWQPLFTDRYLVWTAPAFYLLIALGLASLWRWARWGRALATLLLGAVLISNCGNLWQQSTESIKSDFRAAVAYIASYPVSPDREEPVARAAPEPRSLQGLDSRQYLPLVVVGEPAFGGLVVFQIPYGRHAFDYYSPTLAYTWAKGLYTNHRAPDGSYLMSEREAAWRMQQMTAGHDVVWLVATEMSMWDERGLVQAWLDANLERADEAHFAHVSVYRFVREEAEPECDASP